jgi:ribonuclease-3
MNHEAESVTYYDAKSKLQQIVQARGQTVTYEMLDATGPDHARVFTAACIIEGQEVSRGQGRTKKAAQQAAAGEALRSGKCI